MGVGMTEESKDLVHPGLEVAANTATVASGLPLPPTTASTVLSAAADLIDATGWTQGELARNQDGDGVIESSPDAVCFCASGAVWRASDSIADFRRRDAVAGRALRALSSMVGVVPDWNDAPNRTQSEVVTALRQAAEKAREQGQ